MEFFLGIDLGTTSVKITIIDGAQRIFLERERVHSKLHPSAEKGDETKRHEQCPKQILFTLRGLMDEIDVGTLIKLKGIAISGQMHGVMLWKDSEIRSELDQCHCSRLITWMDARCDQQFLAKLPRWTDEDGVEKRISTGYGMATLAWLKAHGEFEGKKWNRAGTIMDFFVTYLTHSKNTFISTQNAVSWGFVNRLSWSIQDDSDIFPIHLLPSIVLPDTFVGRVSVPFSNLPLGIPVLVALGDLQTSLLPILDKGEAALQLGTASQIAFISNRTNAPQALPNPAIRQDPYFDGDYLLVAPSLNGGNVFDCFFKQISSWSTKLFGPHQTDNSHISSLLSQILNSTFSDKSDTDSNPSLIVQPTFYGERHIPSEYANVKNWSHDTSLEEFVHSMARGIIMNLCQMMPEATLIAHSITRLRMIGRANQKVFIEEARCQFPNLKIVSEERTMSAAYGAALWAQKNYKKVELRKPF